MKKSGLADSPFFYMPQSAQTAPITSPPDSPVPTNNAESPEPDNASPSRPIQLEADVDQPTEQKAIGRRPQIKKTPHHRGTMPPRDHDTTVSRYHDTMVEVVRKAVKEFGKEAATHRFTAEEKRAIADIIYAYAGRGVKTSENEITRIAVNFIFEDYRENGENSVLDRVLAALKA